MIIQIGTEVDESRILWKRKESDEWERADIDDLIEAYENRQKEPKPGDSISKQALIDEVLEDGNGAVLSYPAGMYEDELVESIEKQMIQHFIGVIEYVSQVEPKPVREDTISRQAVEEMIKAEMPERGMWEIEGDKEKVTVCEVCIDLMQKLSELPPVEPKQSELHINEPRGYTLKTDKAEVYSKRPKGEWVDRREGTFCSDCDYKTNEYHNFCPYCGADMKGAE